MKCKSIEFLGLSNEILGGGNGLRFRAWGKSMYPSIRDGDILVIEPIGTRKVKPGEVIFYRAAGGRMVAHRVIRKFIQTDKPALVTRGDANAGKGETVYVEQVLGRVKAIERDKRKIPINEDLSRLTHIFYLRIFPFLTKVRPIAGKLVRGTQGLKCYRSLVKRLTRTEIAYKWVSLEDSVKSLLAKKNSKAIGRITTVVTNNPPYDGWWISDTWVHWRYRGLGVGSRLTEILCRFVAKQGGSEVKLLVFQDNKPALSLYRKLGFRQISIPRMDKQLTEEAKKNGRQRIIMKRDLARGSGPI